MASLLACAGLGGALAGSYTLTDLGTGSAVDINRSGKVVGTDGSYVNGAPNNQGGWIYDGTNRTTLSFAAYDVWNPRGYAFLVYTEPAAISDADRIIGAGVQDLSGTRFAFYSDGIGGGWTLGGQKDAYGVNASGVIVGSGFQLDGRDLVFLNGPSAMGRAINAAGQVVGNIMPGGVTKAASFSGGTNALLDLSAVEATIFSPQASDALSINDSGQVVGYVRWDGGDPTVHPSAAYLYANGSAISLGGLGGVNASAWDINNGGLIVGNATLANGVAHAFVYAAGAMADLNGLVSSGGAGWVLTSANAVNDSGVIVGGGTKDGVAHAFLLTPEAANLPPVMNLSPTGTNLFANESFTLGVAAAGSGPLTYQWQHAGTNLPNATNTTYTVAHATATDAGSYLVKVSNAFGTTSSGSATVQVYRVPELRLALSATLTVTGSVGSTVRIEAVDHLGDAGWLPLGTVTLFTDTYLWVDADAPQHAGRFYRAVPLP